ncbi:lysylphosphatidylglycerol synthase transmembrane domain-containing protein [Flexivirga endophytica]|uniref:lysylphosphatidylglycerol synthase transmembrane domain-containing protein n=1 Tax=Flexivirga endophytica TaxID=1849103 RepID=UPI00166D4E6E|nr:lysylphosphatidylglycerol synthase transmembrane domain-containing protein [Flexivirga endophytica]
MKSSRRSTTPPSAAKRTVQIDDIVAANKQTFDEDDGTSPTMPKLSWRLVIHAMLGMALAAVMIGALPWFTSTTWGEIGHHLDLVGPKASLECMGIMLLGLAVYTFTLSAALPGLSHLKASIINVSGSAVSNVLPGGGAVGMASTYMMLRSWGFARRNISTGLIVSGIWNVLFRVGLPLVGIAAVSKSTDTLPSIVRRGAWWGGIIGLLLLIGFVVALIRPTWTAWLGEQLDDRVGPLVARMRRGANKGKPMNLKHILLDQRARISTVTKHGWFPMSFGVIGQLALWFLLFWRVMEAVHVDLPVADLFAAYAIGRLMTAIPFTPGGLGFTEASTVVILVFWGANPAAAGAGVVVFAIFTHIAEIPIGALGWLAWWAMPKTGIAAKVP